MLRFAGMNQDQLAIFGFVFGSLTALVALLCSLKILSKLRPEGFGISDICGLTGRLYFRYAQEAKRRNWSLLPLYFPPALVVLGCCFVLILVLRASL